MELRGWLQRRSIRLDGFTFWLLLLLAALCMPPPLATALRMNFGIGINVALVCSFAATLTICTAAGVVFRPARFHLSWLLSMAPFVGLGAWAVWALNFPEYGGLPSVGGGDAGNHVLLYRLFVEKNPNVYAGSLSFHSAAHVLVHWFDQSIFRAFANVFFSVPVLLAVCVALLAQISEGAQEPRAWSRVVRLWLVALLLFATGSALTLPLIHYLQADGFFPHVVGILPVLMVWLCWVLFDAVALRLLAGFVGVAFCRYTYGLNFPELAATLAIVSLLELRGRSRFARVGLVLASGAFGWALYESSMILLPLRETNGGLMAFKNVPLVVTSTAQAGAAILALGTFALGPSGSPCRRAATFMGASLLSATLLEGLYLYQGFPQAYYFLKHLYQPVMLAGLGLALTVGTAIAQALVHGGMRERATRLLKISPLIAMALISFLGLREAVEFYRMLLGQRMHREMVFQHILDEQAASWIEQTLGERGARFGGYFTPSWSESSFTNTLFRSRFDGWQVYATGAIEEGRGHCYFWLGKRADMEAMAAVHKELQARVVSLNLSASKECVDYVLPGGTGTARRLCAVCN